MAAYMRMHICVGSYLLKAPKYFPYKGKYRIFECPLYCHYKTDFNSDMLVLEGAIYFDRNHV